MRLIVISNHDQLDEFLAGGYRPDEFTIFCDNLSFSAELTRRGLSFSRLDEFLLREQWQKVNAYGCQAAATWVKLARLSVSQAAYDFPAVLYLHLSHILVNIAKNFLYAGWLIETVKPEAVLLFEGGSPMPFPHFSGNFFLNHFLAEVARQRKIATQTIGKKPPEIFTGPSGCLPARDGAKSLFRSACQNVNALFSSARIAKGIWVYGSLRHLRRLLLQLKKRKIPFFLYDRHFNFAQFFFALMNGVPYITPSTKEKTSARDREIFVSEHWTAILDSFDEVAKKGTFLFEGNHFDHFIRGNILRALKPFLGTLAESEAQYRAVLDAVPVSALLTDEDYGDRGGFLCAFLKKAAIPSYCISHSATAVDFKVSKDVCCIGQSTTFVNSEFERDAYVARGWDPAAFRLTGIPRYDAFSNKRSTSFKRKPSDPLRLLFCANLFVNNYDYPDRTGYLGHLLYSMSETVKPTAELFIRTVKQVPGLKVSLKPHGIAGIREWERLVIDNEAQECVKIVRSRDVINRFFVDHDAMIISYWSTTLIEAAVNGLPIIFMDFTQTMRPSVEEFAKAGFCKIVRNERELRESLIQLRENRSHALPVPDASAINYFLGRRDEKASERVADFLQTELVRHQREK